MTFGEAMRLADEEGRMIRRASWDGLEAIVFREAPDHIDDPPTWMPDRIILDNAEGYPSGSTGRYKPTQEDQTADDWEVYDARKALLNRTHRPT